MLDECAEVDPFLLRRTPVLEDNVRRLGPDMMVFAELLGVPGSEDWCSDATDEELKAAKKRVYGRPAVAYGQG